MSLQHFDHYDDAYSLLIRVQTMLNHIRFVFYHNFNIKESGFFSEREVKRKLKMALRDILTCVTLSVLFSMTAKLSVHCNIRFLLTK